MKRIAIALVALSSLAALTFAQPYGGGMMGGGRFGGGPGYGLAAPQTAAQTKTLDGTLTFINNWPAIKAKDATYIIHMPGFFRTAYLDGIKDGATLKLEGYDLGSVAGQANPYFEVTKATVNGKTYDLSAYAGYGRGAFGGRGMMGGFGGGQGYGPGMMGGRGRW